MSLRHNCKTSSWRRLEDALKTSEEDVLQTRLEDALEDENLLRWRRLEDVLQNRKCLQKYVTLRMDQIEENVKCVNFTYNKFTWESFT